MPWKVRKGKGKRPFKIVRKDTGKVVGSSTSEADAAASVRARYANTPDAEAMSRADMVKHMGRRKHR